MPFHRHLIIPFLLLGLKFLSFSGANQESARLFEDLLSKYNKLVRPGKSPSDAIEIQFKFKLVQILDVHEKNQVLTTKGSLIHRWTDQRLSWEPIQYGNVTMLHVPGELIWVPDIILYNNAHGSPTIAAITKADVYANGSVFWEPPVVYNSMCAIDIKWFPYDEQECYMKFGSWTYGGFELDMVHLDTDVVEHVSQENGTVWNVELGVDISEYQESVEFELLSVIGRRHEKRYPCCDYPWLFYTVNLMIPCVGIAILTSFVFYLPNQSHNKINLCINILVSLSVFFLLLIEIIPPTSLTTPLIGKYLIFTMCMVTASVVMTVVVENIHYRDATPMPPFIRHLFINLFGRHYNYHRPSSPLRKKHGDLQFGDRLGETQPQTTQRPSATAYPSVPELLRWRVEQMGQNICYIEQTVRRTRRNSDLHSDWTFVALVLDRLMLVFFSTTILAGTMYTWFSAPSLTDYRVPITTQFPPKPLLF
uniref:Neur_chan_LBD domain-containing protein n=1 Tax=Globodera pallida TaxID=36090 RepID=A0A183C4W0_GLOPA